MLLMATIIAQVVVLTIKRVFDLMFLQNVVIFSLVPDYTMFGSQHFNQVPQANRTNKSMVKWFFRARHEMLAGV